jgi:4-oxalocrotonate tautomerase
MPHVIIKMYPGRTEAQKQELCDRIVKDVMEVAGCGEDTISLGIEEIPKEDWAETVYKPDILDRKGTLYKLPGYNPFGD